MARFGKSSGLKARTSAGGRAPRSDGRYGRLSGSRKALGILWAVPAVMAMEGPGCVMSEQPLARDDTIDERLLGEWIVEGDPESKRALWIGLADAETVEARWFENDGSYIVLTGHTSSIGDARYANLQFVDAGCTDCDPAELAAIKADFDADFADVVATDPANDCTHLILRYVLDADGRLQHFGMPPELALGIVESGELAGEERSRGGEALDSGGGFGFVCLTASADALRSFVRSNGSGAFTERGEIMVRRE